MTAVHARLSAALADRYRIERELGQGGMATVYLAEDLKHKRKVAVKVLKPELAAVLGAERFVVEITTTAALQHPHILPLFDSGAADGFLFYVMPFIDGETLRAKLDRETQLGVDESVRIAREVLDALHYAHEHGIVHRDVKPENILLHGGHAMVADFGIALAVSAAAGGRMTETGLSLGTPHYMSPEQATAEKEITARSDVYSLGSVLYEMLTGDTPHTGSSAQQIMMKIITDTPRPVTELRKSVPDQVAAAVAQALEKLPADRFASAADFAAALDGRFATRRVAETARAPGRDRQWRRIAMVVGGVAIASLALAGWALASRRAGSGADERVEFAFRPFTSTTSTYVAISPDGRKIVQAITDSSGKGWLVMRELGSESIARIPGTEGAEFAAFSPKGDWLAIRVENSVRKLPAAGGPTTELANDARDGIDWGPDGSVLYTKREDGLWRVGAAGGEPQRLTTIDRTRREFQHWQPQALPGGRAAIFNNFSTPLSRSRIEAVEYASGKRTVLVEGAFFARYLPGYLLFMREHALFAVRFDPAGLRVLGTPVPVLEDVSATFTHGLAGYAVSSNGTLVWFKESEGRVPRRVVWADRTGAEQDALPEPGMWAEPRISPDGRWIALTRIDPGWQLWLFDLQRRFLAQLTRSDGVSFDAVWMPDSKSIIHSVETPVYDLHRSPIDGSPAETLRVSTNDKFPSSVSRDGRTLVYADDSSGGRLLLAPISGGALTVFDARSSGQRNADFSPDGRWLAYEEEGANRRAEVYVRAIDGKGGRHQVSNDGGGQPRWTRGGREIVYRQGDALLSTSFNLATGEAGTPQLLFRKRDMRGAGEESSHGYDVTPDGSRFLLVTPVIQSGAAQTRVVINWAESLKLKVPR